MNKSPAQGPVIVDSVTALDPGCRGRVLVTGSHAGRFAAVCAARSGIRAVIFNDASVGKDAAGIAGLLLLEELGIAAAAVDAGSAEIGRAQSTWDEGIISHANRPARDLNVRQGMFCKEAAALLADAPVRPVHEMKQTESRALLDEGPPPVWALDSASLVSPEDAGAILFTGSHGGLLGGRPETALKAPARAAVYNDAGTSLRSAGTSRLPVLEQRGIAAATVSAASARIGDGRSTYEDGIISRINACAAQAGARIGMTSREFASLVRKIP